MDIDEIMAMAFHNAVARGYYQGRINRLAIHAEIATELAEASREVMTRPTWPAAYQDLQEQDETEHQGLRRIVAKESILDLTQSEYLYLDSPPKGELIELADVVLRIASYCGYMGYDLARAIELKLRFNETRVPNAGIKRH